MTTAEPSLVLQKILSERKLRNPSYSLRAFARDLDLSPAFLSYLLKGERRLNLRKARKISDLLGLNQKETQNFLRSVAICSLSAKAEGSMVEGIFNRGTSLASEYSLIELDRFRMFSDWYHVVILDLSTCRGFKDDPHWIAEQIGISAGVAGAALDRLERLGLMKRTNGKLRKTSQRILLPTQNSELAVRSFHAQMIEKAKEHLNLTAQADFERRNISGTTMAIDVKNLELAKKKIIEFQQEIADLLTTGDPTEVYQLNVQFFPLTKGSLNESN